MTKKKYKILETDKDRLWSKVESEETGEPTKDGEELFHHLEELMLGKRIKEIHQIQDGLDLYPDGRGIRIVFEDEKMVDFQAYYGSGYGLFSVVCTPPQVMKIYCWNCGHVEEITEKTSNCKKCESDYLRFVPKNF